MSESAQFLLFSLAVAVAYYASKSITWRHGVLLAANLGFFAMFFREPAAYLPLALFVLASYAGLWLIERSGGRGLTPVVLVTLAVFLWLKKYAFLPGPMLLPFSYLTIGLSYILFRVLHLMIDTGSAGGVGRPAFGLFFRYITNFTTLVSGPIQRYEEFAQRQASPPALTCREVAEAIERIGRGLFKTNVLAMLLSTAHTRMTNAVLVAGQPFETAIVAGVAMLGVYPFFLYCNFSGYIDVVIGVSRLLGAPLPENFVRPFSATSIIDFWSNRWHVTLSGWLRTYVYNPLLFTLMRRFPSPALQSTLAVLAFFITFFLIGLWHGQTSEFVFYGGLLGLGVSVNRMYQAAMTRRLGQKNFNALGKHQLYAGVSRGLTFAWNAFTLLWFWSSWPQIAKLSAELGMQRGAVVLLALLVSAALLLAIWEAAYARLAASELMSTPLLADAVRVSFATALLMVTATVTWLMNQPAPAIVYKAF